MPLVALEGIDGSGKSTQASLLIKKLSEPGKAVASFAFPSQGILGAHVRALLRGEWSVTQRAQRFVESALARLTKRPELAAFVQHQQKADDLRQAHVIQSLMTADRYAHAGQIRELLAQSLWVVCDRWVTSAYVYGTTDGIDLSHLIALHSSLPKADLEILLDIPVDVSLQRRPERRDDYEKNVAKMEQTREYYLTRFKENGGVVIDANREVERVHEAVVNAVTERFPGP